MSRPVRVVLFLVVTLLAACSSADDSTQRGCALTSNARVVSVTRVGGDASCPDVTPAEINEPAAGEEACEGVEDQVACSVRFDCASTDPDGYVTRTNGVLRSVGANLSGEVTISVTEPGGSPVVCVYEIVAK